MMKRWRLVPSVSDATGRASSVPAKLPTGPAIESWYWRGRALDPVPAWRAVVHVPVLAVYGAADELMPANRSAKLVEHALSKGGNHDVTVRVFPRANHMIRMLPGVARDRWDWPRVAPGYLELVTEWLREHSQLEPVPDPKEMHKNKPRSR